MSLLPRFIYYIYVYAHFSPNFFFFFFLFYFRDIKPENLLFKPIQFMKRRGPAPILQPEDDEPKIDEGEFIEGYGGGGIGKIKIADFGLSKVIENNNHQAKTPCGTIGI